VSAATDRHTVTLVRHGQTDWSISGKHTGLSDIALTDLGRRQAAALGTMLDGAEFAMVVSSPLVRAHQTMELSGFGDAGADDNDLVEWDYGVYEGRRTADIRLEIPDWSVWTHPMLEGESVDEVGARADRVIDRLLDASGPSLVFGHGHMLRILATRWTGLPAINGRALGLSTATVSTLGWERENRVIRHWNEACHLRSMDPEL